MIDPKKLLSDVKPIVRRLDEDLRERATGKMDTALRKEFAEASRANRTADTFEEWLTDRITQMSAAWVLSCVFVRFLEDNSLTDPPKIAGPAERRTRALEEHQKYFESHPKETDREYLLFVFDALAKLPGGKEIFGPHNPIRSLPEWISGDGARLLLGFFQAIDSETGLTKHDFTDPDLDTRFLGDLYQDLSEYARKKYALLQTPEFVEEFILDRTLEPAIAEFGLDAPAVKNGQGQTVGEKGFRMIDPACGSGHFLLGSFERILSHWQKKSPGKPVRELVQKTLESIHGVDINPYAVSIARFRLLLAALKACGIHRLADAPTFVFHLTCGDSLIHGHSPQGHQQTFAADWTPLAHYFLTEDAEVLDQILVPGRYHAVVANPPYITPKDSALNKAYRERYATCHRQYSLAVPFLERIYQLAVFGGFTGQITANSFMKREFGKKLIEAFFPKVDLTHVIDTSGAYIPGHGTPTVILYGRNRKPVAPTIRTVLGIRGEPATPADPSLGLVWSAIKLQLDRPGSASPYVSVSDSLAFSFHEHPWSIGGGGAVELKDHLDTSRERLRSRIEPPIGRAVRIGQEDAFIFGPARLHSTRIDRRLFRPYLIGENIRDWATTWDAQVLYPYSDGANGGSWQECLWIWRTMLARRATFQGQMADAGLNWFEYMQHTPSAYRTPLSIAFAFVATHNHFVLDRGGKVFKQSAPVIKLKEDATEDDHLGLLGLLNSSVACFWIKQVSHNKGSSVDQHGARQTTVAFENFWEHDGTKLSQFPVCAARPLPLSARLDSLAQQLSQAGPAAILKIWCGANSKSDLRKALKEGGEKMAATRSQLIGLQEELDWFCYSAYGLVTGAPQALENPPSIHLGQRAFEIGMARKIELGELETTWFARHGSTPTTQIPEEWPADYRKLVGERIKLIESDPNIALIEQPEYKRRWNTEPWDSQVNAALESWLLDRLESYFDLDGRMNEEHKATARFAFKLVSVAELAELARTDPQFLEAGSVYRDDTAFDVAVLVTELVMRESVPLLPVLRYKESGMRTRALWEKTWDSQRKEDAIDARAKLLADHKDHLTQAQADAKKKKDVGAIPVPPKYGKGDFLTDVFWKLRGKLDVPKERWISFPHCEGQDGTLMIAWAGYDHLQLAKAVGEHYVDVKERLGGQSDPRLVPLLACILELVPWLKQWHNEPDPNVGVGMGDYFEGYVNEEALSLQLVSTDLRNWNPPRAAARRRRQ